MSSDGRWNHSRILTATRAEDPPLGGCGEWSLIRDVQPHRRDLRYDTNFTTFNGARLRRWGRLRRANGSGRLNILTCESHLQFSTQAPASASADGSPELPVSRECDLLFLIILVGPGPFISPVKAMLISTEYEVQLCIFGPVSQHLCRGSGDGTRVRGEAARVRGGKSGSPMRITNLETFDVTGTLIGWGRRSSFKCTLPSLKREGARCSDGAMERGYHVVRCIVMCFRSERGRALTSPSGWLGGWTGNL